MIGLNRRTIRAAALACIMFGTAGAVKWSTNGQELFRFSGDSRYLALGASCFSDAAGASAIFINPTGMADSESQSEILLSFTNLSTFDVRRNTLGYLLPGQGPIRFGLGVIQRRIEDIPDTRNALYYWDSQGPHLNADAVRYLSHNELGLLLAGTTVWRNIRLGFVLKPVFVSVADHHAWGLGADLALTGTMREHLTYSVKLEDFPSAPRFWDSGDRELFPPRIKVGGHYRTGMLTLFTAFAAEPGTRLEDDSRALRILGTDLTLHGGMELKLFAPFSIQIGSASTSPFSGGFRWQTESLDIQYAWSRRNELSDGPDLHRITLIFNPDLWSAAGSYLEP